jgi:hypothetical protein
MVSCCRRYAAPGGVTNGVCGLTPAATCCHRSAVAHLPTMEECRGELADVSCELKTNFLPHLSREAAAADSCGRKPADWSDTSDVSREAAAANEASYG